MADLAHCYIKDIDTTINVADPVNFSAGKMRHILVELNNRYVGRCFMGGFICGIEGVNRAGPCHLVSTNTSGGGYVDVQFRARVAAISRWDILVGVVVGYQQQIIVGTYVSPAKVKAIVTVLAAKGAETLAVGQRIAVRVIRAQHQPMQPQVSVAGTLLVCDQVAPVYRLQGGAAAATLPREARAELAPLLQRIEAELEARAELVKTRAAELWFFERLLYSYRDDGKAGADDAGRPPQAVDAWPGGLVWAGPPGAAGHDGLSILAIARRVVVDGEEVDMAGFWTRPLNVHRSSPLVATSREQAPPAEWGEAVIDSTARVVAAEFLKNILDFLAAARELTEQYNTRKLVDDHFNVWATMRAAQMPPELKAPAAAP
jgi:hypothetical protein